MPEAELSDELMPQVGSRPTNACQQAVASSDEVDQQPRESAEELASKLLQQAYISQDDVLTLFECLPIRFVQGTP